MRTVPSPQKLGVLVVVAMLLGAVTLLFDLTAPAEAKKAKVEVCYRASKKPPTDTKPF